jgi:hypothetical protein
VADALVKRPLLHSPINMASLERAGCAHLVAGWTAIAERAV